MIETTIEKIAELCGGRLNAEAQARKDEMIRGVSIDTRTLEKNNLFVPFKGENADGHRFIQQAFDIGAALSLTEQPVEERGQDLPLIHVEDGLRALQDIAQGYLKEVSPKVIAITGSNGKTTTKDMVECLLSPHFKVKKTIGNYNNEIGLPLTILQLDRDTEISILEMGMDAKGDIRFLSRMTTPDIAILTNVGESHIEKLGSRENIAHAKYEIVDGLLKDGTFIYSRDYPLLEDIVDRSASYNVRTAGQHEENDLQIAHVRQTPDGTRFELLPMNVDVGIPQLGTHNAANASLALLAAEALGLDIVEVKNHFENLVVTNMRMERVSHKSGATIINDAYNASPSSMKSALDTVGRMETGRRILVLGDILELGSYSEPLHQSIAQHINDSDHIYDYLFTFGEASKIIHDHADMKTKHHHDDIESLADALQHVMTEDSVVLLKGSRGMALERVIDHI
ncbi:UDP-N-acetylmuramoyl-tripeptide--D-alanyl-D-alanine ligase [Salinicoccus hispanicus]|uniref:UDP-N-acetylmuramoyl-tripeptide--D-alanyl-D-alanine ligase n=1 Tax=Salinicoccus hispanicus TaxID=157225 RepID=A0A6N8TZ54_9STAP|nr:UDP-N-acetylmuramoyl-tripeptide--D-alanyl-D-alanine ligase [Salinicoccus hispanicus]MXQ51124.1 UDP-N-acetylmuramoyl-tripeptide--D-alanyl-D-alanine ligase [Salinicoccus hispanicus]